MTAEKLPTTIRAWQYTTTSGGLDKNLKLNSHAPLPKPKEDEHLIQVLAAATNPMDYKPAETPLHYFAIAKPATSGSDFAGRIITPAPSSSLEAGTLVFGASPNALAGGTMAEYVCVPSKACTVIPPGVTPIDAAGIPMAAITAWESTVPFIKAGQTKLFINGASGGVGTFAIQFAKYAGAHVTASCSSAKIDLVKSLGADEVVDYRSPTPLTTQLRTLAGKNGPFDRVIDNVGTHALYWEVHHFSKPGAVYSYVGFGPSVACIAFLLRSKLLPSFMGGGKRKMEVFVGKHDMALLDRIMGLVNEKKVRVIVDEVFGFEDVVAAYRRQKSGRARGKVVVEVAKV